ncbi:hypothetical protein D3C87_720020 [compost metagenome]
MQFSFYKGGIEEIKPCDSFTLEQAVSLIASETYAPTIKLLREASNEATRDMIKKKLDYFTFSGTFKKRNNNFLIAHSGYIGIDLDPYRKNKTKQPELVNPRLVDEFEAVRWELTEDPYTCAIFVSPSGNGYKVIIKIDGSNHLNSWKAIRDYYLNTYRLVLDKGVNDVSRACFVSSDAKIYFNPESKLWDLAPVDEKEVEKPTAKTETKENTTPSASERMKLNKDLERAIHVVEQAELRSVDLTGDYSDWQQIAFSLATFGEDGRSLFHRVSKIYSEYNQKEAEAKFDDALAKGRFKTPGKFFSLAKDYGLETKMPKTLQEKQAELTYLDILGDADQAEEMTHFGFYEKGGRYHSVDMKGKYQEISNFKMRIIYHVETSDEEAYRLIQIKNVFGHDVVIKMNTDDFVSIASFRKIIARKGNFLFKGNDADLCRLQDKLQRDEVTTELVKQLGYNRKFNFYAFANGIFDCNQNKFVPIDNLGIVKHEVLKDGGEVVRHDFFIPAMSKMFVDKDDLYTNDKRFLHVESGKTFKEWSELFCEVYGTNGQISLTFYLISIFSDIVYRSMDSRFPMLNVYGQKGTGKGTMIESMMKLFGLGQKQLMLGGASTVVGMMRKSGQFSNAMLWMDEYKNNLKPTTIESLKNFYDRIGYERGKKDNTFQTESTRIDSAIIVSGQEMPIIEEALFSRFLLLITKRFSRTEETRQNFLKLKEWEENGLSDITVHLMQYRGKVAQHFKAKYAEEQRTLAKAVNNADVDERFINNYASIIAMADLLRDEVHLPFTIVDFRELCKRTLLEQFFVLKGSDSIGKWWSIVEQLFNTREISENRHFIIEEGKLFIRIQDVFQHYAETMQKRKDAGVLDEATLRNYLESDPKNFVERKKKFFGGSQRWCMVFKYEGLGIDLIAADSEQELQAKYLKAGIANNSGLKVPKQSPIDVQGELLMQTTAGDYITTVDNQNPPF